MRFIDTLHEKLRRHPKRIVFPEGTEPRVLAAASKWIQMGLGPAILLGKREVIEATALRGGINLDRLTLIDPATADDLPQFCAKLERLKRYRDLGDRAARDLLKNANYFGAMMIQHGQADGLVGGASEFAGMLLRPLIQLVQPLPGIEMISSCMVFDLARKEFGANGLMLFADCAVVPEPTVSQLAEIAVQTGRTFRQLTGEKPRVAMLSFSTKGSSRLPSAEKVAAAAALARQRADAEGSWMEVDGELQADAAIDLALAKRKAPQSLVAGQANVLIFPDLEAGNIAAKLVHYFAGGDSYGQILLGLSKPAADVPRGASTDEILGCAAIVGLQAIEYRRLYPDDSDAPQPARPTP
jgi:phosphate acetyltransferase